jgi:hypothetical protein
MESRARRSAGWRGRVTITALFAVAGPMAIASCTLLSGVSKLVEVDCAVGCPGEAGHDEKPNDAREKDSRAPDEGAPVCTACGGPTSASCCDGTCVDLVSDPSHCGACKTSCATGLCGTTIAGLASSLWQANGSATIGTGQFGSMTGILTGGGSRLAGTIVYAHAVVVDSFTATFSFYIGGGTAGGDSGLELGGDGMAFVFESNGPTAVTKLGSCFGVCGLDGYGVELDTYDNDGCGDTNANHVSVDSLAECTTTDDALLPTTLFSNGTLPFTLSDATMHTATVVLDKGAMTVTLDGTTVVDAFAIPGFASGKSYHFGFGGGTGGAVNFHEVGPNLTITFPSPRCL